MCNETIYSYAMGLKPSNFTCKSYPFSHDFSQTLHAISESHVLLNVGLKACISRKLSHCTWGIYTSQTRIYRKNCKLYLGHCQEVMNEVSGGVTPILFPWVLLVHSNVFAGQFQNMQGCLLNVFGITTFTWLLEWCQLEWNNIGSEVLFSVVCIVLFIIKGSRKSLVDI